MLIDRATAKSLLRVSNTDYDDYIDAVIPPLQHWMENFLNDDFISDRVFISSQNLVFDGDEKSITCQTENIFGEYQFKAGIDILVHGSFNNDGLYEVDTASPDKLVLVSGSSIVNEDATDQDYTYRVSIAKKEYPKGAKLVFAKLIGFNLRTSSLNPDDIEAKSESFTGYSINNGVPMVVDSGKYPANIIADLVALKSRRVKLH